ncbi:MAG: Dam family site-specific DNA-(adenine-N6)-methyltransferase [Proteobacteria bacterium]|nr:Dam family site-specific DNA-(adenine-N6)-methyltransferase [Pseudomonadota bacterium]
MRSQTRLSEKLEIKPPLKWAGGKRWLLPHLLPIWRRHARRRLVEPMCGGLGVALGLLPREALLNDINPHAINLYRWLREGLEISAPMENDEAFYYACRDRFNALIREGRTDTQEAAGLFYYLNRTGFNGLCRFNRSGLYNVPFGRYAKIGYVRDFRHYAEVFRSWEFNVGDFEAVALRSGDFAYADPPYDVEFTQYAKEGFSWDDQVRLAQWLARHDGPVVLSNQATPRILELYRSLGYRLTLYSAPRSISSNGDRTQAVEVLARLRT